MIVLLSWLWTIFGVLSGETFLYLLIRKKAQNLSVIAHICLSFTFGFMSTIFIMFVLVIFHIQSIYTYIAINLVVSIPGLYCVIKHPPQIKRERSRRNIIINLLTTVLILGFLVYMLVIIADYESITNGDAYFFIGQAIEIMHYKPNVLNPYFMGNLVNFYIGDFFLCIYLLLFDYTEAIVIIQYLPVFLSLIAFLGIFGFIRDTYHKPFLGVIALLLIYASKVFSSYLFSYSRHTIVLLLLLSFHFLLFKAETNNILIGIVMAVCIYVVHSPSLLLIGLGYLYYYISIMTPIISARFTRIYEKLRVIFSRSIIKRIFLLIFLPLNFLGYYFSKHSGSFRPLTLLNWNHLSMNAVLTFIGLGFALYVFFITDTKKFENILLLKSYAFFSLVLFTITNNIYWWNLLTGMPYNALRYIKYYEFGLIFLLTFLFHFVLERIQQWYKQPKETHKVTWNWLREQKIYLNHVIFGLLLIGTITAFSINIATTYFIDEWATKTSDGFIDVGKWMRSNTQNESIVLFPYEPFSRFQTQYQAVYFYDDFVLNYHYSKLYLENDSVYATNSSKYDDYIEWVYSGSKAVTQDSGICQTLLNNNRTFFSQIDYIILYTSYSPHLNELMENDTIHFQKIYEIEVIEQAYWLYYLSEYPPHLFQFVVYEVL